MLDWTHVQAALTRAGFPCGKIDGQPGPLTWTALFAYAAGRQPDAVLKAIGAKAANWLTTDDIAQTAPRLAEFIAQTAHETGGYTVFEEDLRYSAATMLAQWPTHFTAAQARAAVGHPIEIASRAYGGRMGNAPYPSREGYVYRGRGQLMLTGKNAYAKYQQATGLPLMTEPELAADPADSLVIATLVWRDMQVNVCCDRGDFYGARGLTNAGSVRPKVTPIGLDDVAVRRTRLLAVLA